MVLLESTAIGVSKLWINHEMVCLICNWNFCNTCELYINILKSQYFRWVGHTIWNEKVVSEDLESVDDNQ